MAISDVLIAVVGIFRGLGILDSRYVGVTEEGVASWWCYTFTIVASTVWYVDCRDMIKLLVYDYSPCGVVSMKRFHMKSQGV